MFIRISILIPDCSDENFFEGLGLKTEEEVEFANLLGTINGHIPSQFAERRIWILKNLGEI